MNGRIFARNEIVVSFVVKKMLRDDVTESNIKLSFTGTESLSEIHQKIVDAITGCKNETDEKLSDNELIDYMKTFFNGSCEGSLELLESRELDSLARALRRK